MYIYIYVLCDTQIVFCSFAQGCVVADVGKGRSTLRKSAQHGGLGRGGNQTGPGTGKPVISDIDLALIDIASDIPIDVKVNGC